MRWPGYAIERRSLSLSHLLTAIFTYCWHIYRAEIAIDNG